jgi:hypothetical protein
MDYLAPILGFLGVVVTSIGTLLVKHWLEKKSAIELSDSEIKFTLTEINELHQRCLDLQQQTRIDRFLILKAENGKNAPKYTSVVFEQMRDRPLFIATLVYTKILLDGYYQEMLKSAEATGCVPLETATMPEQSKLRGFYENEKVKFSTIYFLARQDTEAKDNDKAIIWFCSMATHADTMPTKAEKLQCQLFVDFVKNMFETRIKTGEKK